MAVQTSDNMRGEVTYRRDLIRQQVEGAQIFEDEFDAGAIRDLLRERMEGTCDEMTALRSQGVTLSPYLEIGAERGQRSLVMENDLGCEGAALDLSFDMLRSCDHYREAFAKARNPLRICADAYHLPFRSGSVPFVFCAQTLHHFPDPAPIIREIYRVLAPGGHFYFSEEPFKQLLHFNLYEIESSIKRDKEISRARRIFERFFAKVNVTEERYGVIENDEISLATWKEALAVFEEKTLTLRVWNGRIQTDLLRPRNRVKYLAAALLGGAISGLCRKPGRLPEHLTPITAALTSPLTSAGEPEVSLVAGESSYTDAASRDLFPVVDGVAFLMDPALREKLYPELTRPTHG